MHLEALSRLSTLLMNPGFKEGLLGAKTKEEFLTVIDEAESDRFGEEKKEENFQEEKAAAPVSETPAVNAGSYRVLAVTACPTGIAHTYMAAENLENTGKKLGIALKAETDGSGGAQNVLT